MANEVPTLNPINAPQTVTGPSQTILPSSLGTSTSSAGSGLLGTLGNLLNYVPVVGPILNGIISTVSQGVQNEKNRQFEREQAAEQRSWNESMMDKQNEFTYNMWQKTNEYNSPAAQVARLRQAGLNPLYYGLDGSSANGIQSAQALGYDRASVGNQINPMSVGIESAMQAKSLQKDIELKNAQIDQINANTKGTELDNEWKDKTMEARTESENLKNEALRGDIKIKEQDLKNKAQELEKLIAETKNETAKYGYIMAQTAVQTALEAKTKEETASIIALRPYEIALKQAQSYAQRAAGAASYASAAINNGLLKAGYVEKTIDKLIAETEASEAVKKNADVQRLFNEYKLAIRNGTVFDTGMPVGPGQQFVHDVFGKFFQIIAITGDSLGGLSGAAGAAAGAVVGSSVAPSSKPSKPISWDNY